jgi:hypothetical protein
MFEDGSPDGLLAQIETCHQWESMVIGRRLAAVAQLLCHRIDEVELSDPDPGYALISGFARTTAEVGAALNLPPMAAREVVSHAEALDNRLPVIATLLRDGQVDWPTVRSIITRSNLVADHLIEELDRRLAERITTWQCWSRSRIRNAVDGAIRALDPDAAKERRVTADTERHISVTATPNGMADVRGCLTASASAIFDKRLSELATSVCANDSRTVAQRRADAVVALSRGVALACDCGRPDCPRRGTPASGGVRIVINVIADESTLSGRSNTPGYLEGYGVIDAEEVRELADGATLRLLDRPRVNSVAALRYQPSASLAQWIRCRDLTCRFPGCDRPAWRADIDHTRPFDRRRPEAGGLTVPTNLGCYCREHHRLKTFHGGSGGWRDEQSADGVIVWISPTGRRYRTTPDGGELFPQLSPPPTTPPPRRRNRTRDRARRRALARDRLREQRPHNAEQLRINRARRQEISDRKWRNQMRKMLHLLKQGPSTSPWCTWVNDPFESEEITADWRPPPPPSPHVTDEPPF